MGREEWIRFHQNIGDELFEVTGKKAMSDEQIRRKILLCTGGRKPHKIASWAKTERDAMVRSFKEEGLSIRQIERVTGISRGIVARC
jgi:putative transposase